MSPEGKHYRASYNLSYGPGNVTRLASNHLKFEEAVLHAIWDIELMDRHVSDELASSYATVAAFKSILAYGDIILVVEGELTCVATND